jgi:hypothetical protein
MIKSATHKGSKATKLAFGLGLKSDIKGIKGISQISTFTPIRNGYTSTFFNDHSILQQSFPKPRGQRINWDIKKRDTIFEILSPKSIHPKKRWIRDHLPTHPCQ